MEEEVLLGAEKKIAEHKPILYVETAKSDEKAIEKFLCDLGYELTACGINVLGLHCDDPCKADVSSENGVFSIVT